MISGYCFERVQRRSEILQGKANAALRHRVGREGRGSQASARAENPSRASVQPVSTRVFEAIDYIEEHLGDPNLTIEGVARHLNVSANHLARSFRRETGRRMVSFIVLRRIERAKALLSTTDWQIKRIAHQTGHANANWFCYLFQAVTGQAPKAYRAESRASRNPWAGSAHRPGPSIKKASARR